MSPTPDGEYTGRALVKLIFNIGKVNGGGEALRDERQRGGAGDGGKGGSLVFYLFYAANRTAAAFT